MTSDLSLYDYWRIVNKRKWIVLFAFACTLFSTAFYTRLQKPVYKSQAVVKIQPPASYAKIPGADLGNWDPWGMVATEIRVIHSNDISERAARNLGWINSVSNPEDVSKSVSGIASSFKAERIQDSNLIGMTAAGPNPLLAADIVNAVVDAYISYDLEERSRQAKKTLEDISARKNEVEESLRSLERSKQNFLEQNPDSGMGGALAGQFVDLEARRKELLKKYTAQHPEIIQIDQRIQSIQSKLAGFPSQELELARIVRELRMNEEIYTALNRQYEEAKIGLASVVSFVSVISKAVPPSEPVFPNKKLNLLIGSMLGIFLGLAFVFIVESLDVSISTIEEIEHFVDLPVLGIIPHLSSPSHMDNWLTGIFKKPRYSVESFRKVLVFHHSAKSPAIESYHTIRANIGSQLNTKKESTAVVFSSAGVAEGKTLTAVNFSIASAYAGLKTLLIDADMRRPSIYRIFGISRQAGLSEILAGKTPWEKTMHSTADFLMGELSLDRLLSFPGIDNLKIITCGMPAVNVVDLISSADWARLIRELKNEFDMIVFDSTPVLLFVDAVIMAKHSDGVVLVYKAGKMARGALKRSKEQVISGNARMIGVVLNDMRASEMGPHYGYYRDYGHYSRPAQLEDDARTRFGD